MERTWSKSGFMAEKSRFALCATGTVRCAACSLSRFHRSISFADETDDAMPTALSRPAPGRVEVWSLPAPPPRPITCQFFFSHGRRARRRGAVGLRGAG